jgi:predicted metalloprotease with PDZ domain
MKIFQNKTQNNNEKAVKVGKVAPADAANIALYNQDKITASNSLLVTDISQKIKENRIDNDSHTTLMIANELGILEDLNRK